MMIIVLNILTLLFVLLFCIYDVRLCEVPLVALAGALGLLIDICMFCGRLIGIKSSEGAPGGISHGMCDPICRAGKEIV